MSSSNTPSWLSEGATSSATSSSNPDWANPESSTLSVTQQQPPIQRGDETTVDGTVDPGVNGSGTDNKSGGERTRKTWRQFWSESFRRDGGVFLALFFILLLSNIPYAWYAVYPFVIFSTWIHEMCHAITAKMMGHTVDRIEMFPDGSGFTFVKWTVDVDGYDWVDGEYDWGIRGDGFVISAGYQGTAIIGCLLLLIRRTKRGPRFGLMFLALFMAATLITWIRNAFGIAFVSGLAVMYFLAAWFLPSAWMRRFYLIVAASTALNSLFSVAVLYGSTHQVNGEDIQTDAVNMANFTGGSSFMWATIWLLLSLTSMVTGVIFAIPGPDEESDFTLCYHCQKMGCFACLNAPGCKLFGKWFGKDGGSTPSGGASGGTGSDDAPVV